MKWLFSNELMRDFREVQIEIFNELCSLDAKVFQESVAIHPFAVYKF